MAWARLRANNARLHACAEKVERVEPRPEQRRRDAPIDFLNVHCGAILDPLVVANPPHVLVHVQAPPQRSFDAKQFRHSEQKTPLTPPRWIDTPFERYQSLVMQLTNK